MAGDDKTEIKNYTDVEARIKALVERTKLHRDAVLAAIARNLFDDTEGEIQTVFIDEHNKSESEKGVGAIIVLRTAEIGIDTSAETRDAKTKELREKAYKKHGVDDKSFDKFDLNKGPIRQAWRRIEMNNSVTTFEVDLPLMGKALAAAETDLATNKDKYAELSKLASSIEKNLASARKLLNQKGVDVAKTTFDGTLSRDPKDPVYPIMSLDGKTLLGAVAYPCEIEVEIDGKEVKREGQIIVNDSESKMVVNQNNGGIYFVDAEGKVISNTVPIHYQLAKKDFDDGNDGSKQLDNRNLDKTGKVTDAAKAYTNAGDHFYFMASTKDKGEIAIERIKAESGTRCTILLGGKGGLDISGAPRSASSVSLASTKIQIVNSAAEIIIGREMAEGLSGGDRGSKQFEIGNDSLLVGSDSGTVNFVVANGNVRTLPKKVSNAKAADIDALKTSAAEVGTNKTDDNKKKAPSAPNKAGSDPQEPQQQARADFERALEEFNETVGFNGLEGSKVASGGTSYRNAGAASSGDKPISGRAPAGK